MGKRKYSLDEKRIASFIKEGRGQGEGKDYLPWHRVSDVPSSGRVHRVFCPKTGRVHQLLSDNEYYALLLFWWDDTVIDIREQFPLLDRRETLEIAALCGVKHPTDPISGALWVITTDFVVTVSTPYGVETIAVAVKPIDKLSHVRTLEKLEIERRYWERRDVKWSILTDKQLKTIFTQNLAWILDKAPQTIFLDARGFDIDAAVLRELVIEKEVRPQAPIQLVCSIVDHKLNYRAGTALAALRRLLSAKLIRADLHVENISELPVINFSIPGSGALQ